MKSPRLSKSRYMSGHQCALKLWNDCYARELANAIDISQQAIFDTGTAVGELARERYPGGTLVAFDSLQSERALADTASLLLDPSVQFIYEATFLYRDVMVRIDILARTEDGWHLIEVKSGTKFKKGIHDLDIAVQLWVLRGFGLNIVNAGLLTLNRNYIYDGVSLDPDALFTLHDCTAFAETLLPEVEQNMDYFKTLLNGQSAPVRLPGEQCFKPYSCTYYDHCTSGLNLPEHPLTELPRISRKVLTHLDAQGVSEISQIPDAQMLNEIQSRVREATINDTDFISVELGVVLKSIRYPVYHLDFEAFMPAIPQYSGSRPYDSIPFQYSLHIEHDDGQLQHLEFLHTEDSDPREPLTRALISDLGDEGSICVYSGYEKQVIRALANKFPGYAEQLFALIDRLWDLLPVVRDNYYHPDFHGSFSIKNVLPVLVPELGYQTLAIQDGMTAGIAFQNALVTSDETVRQKIFSDLRAYCAMDTEAMVHMRATLLGKCQQD